MQYGEFEQIQYEHQIQKSKGPLEHGECELSANSVLSAAKRPDAHPDELDDIA